MNLKQISLLAVLGVSTAAGLLADVTLVVTGGNATRDILYNRTQTVLSGATVVNGPNSNIRSFVNGTSASLSGLGKITIHYVLNGASQGLQDLKNQANVATTSGGLKPQLVITGNAPETIGVDSSIFIERRSLVVPFVFVKNPNVVPNSIGGVTNLTQRQATYLEGASGYLPTSFFGGSSDEDAIYLVGRNTGAAVRQVIDANIYFSTTPSFWTTNVAPNPPLPPIQFEGHDGGAKVVSDLQVIPNAIGTVAAGDVGSLTPLSYEGVPFSSDNVAKGAYPIWGYERWLTKSSAPGLPTSQQALVINALFAAVTDSTFQHSNSLFVGKYVAIDDLLVERTTDGGPITLK